MAQGLSRAVFLAYEVDGKRALLTGSATSERRPRPDRVATPLSAGAVLDRDVVMVFDDFGRHQVDDHFADVG
jgi:hypothetical protein